MSEANRRDEKGPLQQGVLQRERCRGGAPAAADLVVDVRDVAVDRRDRDDQLSPDLARFQAGGQPRGSRPYTCR